MRRFILLLQLLVSATAFSQITPSAASSPSIDYTLTIRNPSEETFDVEVRTRSIGRDTIHFRFPAWAPGVYQQLDFVRFVDSTSVTATSSNGRRLSAWRSGDGWCVASGGADILFHYRIRDMDTPRDRFWLGVADIADRYAYINGPAVFCYVDGEKNRPCTATLQLPDGWDVDMPLPHDEESRTYRAADYDELVDSPIQMATSLRRIEFEVAGKSHSIVIVSSSPIHPRVLINLRSIASRIVGTAAEMMGGNLPYDHYTFQLYWVHPESSNNWGGLEHRTSTTILGFDREWLLGELAEVMAHEYWHLWNPKRIHVHALGPFDYGKLPRTSTIWFVEGVTEYYARRTIARSGAVLPGYFNQTYAYDVTAFHGGSQSYPLANVSLAIAENDQEYFDEVYTKGALVALLLDLVIRDRTYNERSLDDAMRYLEQEYGKPGQTFSDDQLLAILEHATGVDLREFYDKYIAGPEPLPIAEYLPVMGMRCDTIVEVVPSLGITVEPHSYGWIIASIEEGGGADRMGMVIGDVLVELEAKSGVLVMSTLEPRFLRRLRDFPGTLHYLHDGEPRQAQTIFVDANEAQVILRVDDDASDLARTIRKEIAGTD